MFADYLDDARTYLTADVDPTAAWCREVTGCSAGTSVKLSAALRAEQTTSEDAPAARLISTASTEEKESAA